MNAGLSADHASILYYDGDYPSQEHSTYPENFDQITLYQGIHHDVARYKEIATQTGGPILELCCGTGRVAIPLAKLGHAVTGVDVSAGILDRFRINLHRESDEVSSKITLVEQDITQLSLESRHYPLAVVAFNSLLCVTTFEGQQEALKRIYGHLAPDGLLVLDIVNPLQLKIEGDPVAKPFFTRRNPVTGNIYTRFAMVDAFDATQKQRLHGWYDEVGSDGGVKRNHYSLHWRPIFRYEVELMLKCAGFHIEQIEGGHLKEPYTMRSPRMFIFARK